MTPDELDAELDRHQQELAVIVLNVRAEMTSIGILRARLRHAASTGGCDCRLCAMFAP